MSVSEKATVRDGWSELSTAIDQVVAERNKLREVGQELLSALEHMMEFAERQGWVHVYIEEARAAIQRARGEQ
jgi:hypothetical protein